jgi:FkbM family methyltransferase
MTATNKPLPSGILHRAWRFLQKPADEKSRSFYARWKRLFPNIPVPVRLPFGAWFVGRNDNLGDTLTFDGFEPAERAFVQRFLQPGMTVLDIGAHHGYYTLLASKLVGSAGRVIAFEPSPREQKALRLNLILNRCGNVSVQRVALGREETETTLYVAGGRQTGCNSLRPPAIPDEASPVRVHVTRLDDWLDRQKIAQVDFVKVDVEGAELEVLKGAERLFDRKPRPVILAEVQDVRTRPWGYRAKEILFHLHEKGYKWFSLGPEGALEELDLSADNFEGNFVACPPEWNAEITGMI